MTHPQTIACFNQAVETYENHNDIQRQLHQWAIEHFPQSTISRVLELGCGSGDGVNTLLKHYPEAMIFAVDAGKDLVEKAESKSYPTSNIHWIIADIESWEFPSELELIFSNATLQWIENSKALAQKCADALQSQGELIATSFGPQTYHELTTVIHDVTGNTPSIPAEKFKSLDTLKEDYEQAFSDVSIEKNILKRTWPSMIDLLKTIKWTGTRGPLQSTEKLWTPGFLRACEKQFELRYNGVTLSYETYLLRAIK